MALNSTASISCPLNCTIHFSEEKGEEHDFVIAVSVGLRNMPFFKKMGIELLDRYPISRAAYSFLTYNSGIRRVHTFQRKFSSDSQVKAVVQNLPARLGSRARLDLALVEAKKLFTVGSGSRPHARKVVVIYTDREQTGSDTAAAAKTSKEMEKEGIQIIVILLNMRNVPPICGVVTPNKISIIPSKPEEGPKVGVDKINEVLKEGIHILLIQIGYLNCSCGVKNFCVKRRKSESHFLSVEFVLFLDVIHTLLLESLFPGFLHFISELRRHHSYG